jgi:hypothetical protein
MPDELYPERTADQWLDVFDRVRIHGHAPFSGPKRTMLDEWEQGRNCFLSVIYEVSVTLHRSISDVAGRLVWSGLELRSGPLLGQTASGAVGQVGHYAQIVIRVEIQLDLSNRGDDWTENNAVILRERRDANPPKRSSFDDMPLEFILVHEQMHADDIAAALRDDARNGLKCEGTDVMALDKDLKAKWDKLLAESGHGDPNSPGEESVRRRVWEEWDRRHP